MNKWLLVGVSLCAFGCTETVESTDVRTTGVYPEIRVVADGDGSSVVTVALKVGGNNSNTFLDLESPDTLEVTVGDDTRDMEQRGNDYRVTFPTDEGGTEFTIAFLRDGDGDAPSSTVTLPEPFDLTVEDSEATRPDDSVDYMWDPAGDGNMRWDVDGSCIFDKSGTTPDDGSGTIASDDIDALGSREDEDCTARSRMSPKVNPGHHRSRLYFSASSSV